MVGLKVKVRDLQPYPACCLWLSVHVCACTCERACAFVCARVCMCVCTHAHVCLEDPRGNRDATTHRRTSPNAPAPESAAVVTAGEEADSPRATLSCSLRPVRLAELWACAWQRDSICLNTIHKNEHANKHVALNKELCAKVTHSLSAVRSLKTNRTLSFSCKMGFRSVRNPRGNKSD